MDESITPAEEDATFSLRELRRQMGNSHALQRAIIRRSAESATDVASYAWHLEARLDAISRIMWTLARDPLARFDLRELIVDELADQRMSAADAASLDGSPVALDGAAAEVLALLFHELVTNSVEHGVLGQEEGGDLAVSWRIEPDDTGGMLRLDWIERGAPATRTRRASAPQCWTGWWSINSTAPPRPISAPGARGFP